MHSMVETGDTRKKKPNTVTDYNSLKCVDVMDQMVRKYTVRSGTLRWPVAVFYNLIDISALNAHVLFQACTGVKERRSDFLVKLARELAQSHMAAKEVHKENLQQQPPTPDTGKRALCQVKCCCKNNHATKRCVSCNRTMSERSPSLSLWPVDSIDLTLSQIAPFSSATRDVIGVRRPSPPRSNIHYHVGNLPKDGCALSTLFSFHLRLLEDQPQQRLLKPIRAAEPPAKAERTEACCPPEALLNSYTEEHIQFRIRIGLQPSDVRHVALGDREVLSSFHHPPFIRPRDGGMRRPAVEPVIMRVQSNMVVIFY
ncbi:hypothetical protein MHYP_G00015820 [Metynnis hypsauchen]